MSQIEKLMRSHMVNFATYHGVDPSEELARKAGIKPEDVIRLNANENPYGPLDKVSAALSGLPLHLYPDPNQRKLRAALGEYTGQPVERIMAGAGGDEIIDLLMRLFIAPGQKVLDCEPTFGMYSFSARLAEAEIVSVPRNSTWDIDIPAMLEAIDDSARIVFLASPNNPTGNLLTERDARALLKTGVIVCVDETYYEFSGSTLSPLLDEYENLVILRSFSKWAGIAGLRVGYAIASSELIGHLMDIKQPYNINIAGEAAVLAALEHRGELLERAATLIEQRKRLEAVVDEFPGISYYPSEANFLLCRFERRTAEEAYVGLAQRGIFVRRFPQTVLDSSLRISTGTPEQTDLLIDALRRVV
ncbi:MAG TPA: histidinol-phosphate transaminase [Dehalococcoidia bacterium]|jgi:histidinol-phosphate aminotransferase|nr:histidinol-phosphate transaminase [Chloroflexota bacterium]MEE2840790.1 histidinol-phosphate transaminase [Chloroflexota bacterium]HIM60908.1 histidinol-phosphate transaminase [Dehalococcoidia bacterium]